MNYERINFAAGSEKTLEVGSALILRVVASNDAMRRDATRRDALRRDDHAARSARRKKGEAGAWLVSMTTNHYRRLCHQLVRCWCT